MENLADIFAAEEGRLIAEAQREEAAEKAAWGALTPEQQANAIEARAAKYAALDDLEDEPDDEDEDEDS